MTRTEREQYMNRRREMSKEDAFILDLYRSTLKPNYLTGSMSSHRFDELLDMFNAKGYVTTIMSKMGANKKTFRKQFVSTATGPDFQSVEVDNKYPNMHIVVSTEAEEFYNIVRKIAVPVAGYITELYTFDNAVQVIEFSYENFNFIVNKPLGVVVNNGNFDSATIIIYSPDECREVSYKTLYLEKQITRKLENLENFAFTTEQVVEFVNTLNFGLIRDMKIWEQTVQSTDQQTVSFYLEEYTNNHDNLFEFQSNFKILTDDDYYNNPFNVIVPGKSYCVIKRRYLQFKNGDEARTECYLYLIKAI